MGLGYAVEALAAVPWINNALRKNTWGQNLRLEQERIGWDIAWPTLKEAVAVTRLQ
ncbi:Wadjet anti-phage system protein JetD domain-containing protein [Burkholderia sp. LMU1-1-1.1]|uniref:Wadjet anti-phage system protein JetD domain-containing protein n=1 Tax=Burkholderia sp. LMU1-1-1.1 TaxID=3135266 RepID=UPI00341318C5